MKLRVQQKYIIPSTEDQHHKHDKMQRNTLIIHCHFKNIYILMK